MKVLVVGQGGREHALCWKIRRSPLVKRVFCAPGNAGTATIGENVDIAADDIAALVRFASAEKIDLTVIGPEGPLCAGVVDAFAKQKLACFGPTKAAAEIEGSKTFARELCRRHRIPGPAYWTFDDYQMARSFLANREDGPIVVKASGLAAGKGVTVCKNREEATVAANECLEKRRFGEAGARVVFEEFLEGAEVSLITLTDGRTIVPLEPARDHKAVFDGDKGPNTGGMGVITPVAVMPRMQAQMESQIVVPTVHAMNRENRRYQGFLYAGLMLTTQGPRTLEFNCRLGDPEAQPLLLRLQSDLVPLLLATAEGRLETQEPPVWDARVAVCVVACSAGYPGDYKSGVPIFGLDRVRTGDDLQVFHAGTSSKGGDVLTAGGRVLSVTALGVDAEAARARAYGALQQIEFAGMHYRKDIGQRA
ncbi:MAG TPA: phosphoribosylamine--glycine ligase [Planctomycetota bacterium]|nr:phosphoribosylamine--glycine ligase [Planctomycetota bacterium]